MLPVLLAGAACAGTLCVLLATGCAAGTSNPAPAQDDPAKKTEQTEPVTGGWQASDAVNDILTAADRDRFQKAGADDGCTPATVLATQVVAGTNYAYLCWDDTSWSVDVVYEDLEGNVSVSGKKPIDVSNVATLAQDKGAATGAWADQVRVANLAFQPAEATSALTKAVEASKDELYEVALLGTQVVSGVNYRFLCGTPDTDGAGTLYVVDVYQDLDGNAQITSKAPFDVTAYV